MKSTIALSAVAWLSLSGLAYAQDTGFEDIPKDHWAHDVVKDVATQRGLLKGLADGKFHGEYALTRAEFAASLNPLILDLENLSKVSWRSQRPENFALNDVSTSDPRRAAILTVVNEYGLWNGVPSVDKTNFSPEEPIQRAEAAQVVRNLLALGESRGAVVAHDDSRSYTDVNSSQWAYDAILANGTRYRVMIGYPDKTFRPEREITRFEYAAVSSSTFPSIKDASLPKRDKSVTTYRASMQPIERITFSGNRFQEDRPYHLALGASMTNPLTNLDARVVAYPGPGFVLADLHTGFLDGNPTNVGLAIGPQLPTLPLGAGAHFQVQPFVGGRATMVNYIGLGPTVGVGPMLGVVGELKMGRIGVYALYDGSLSIASLSNANLNNLSGNLDTGAEFALTPGLAFTAGGTVAFSPLFPAQSVRAGLNFKI